MEFLVLFFLISEDFGWKGLELTGIGRIGRKLLDIARNGWNGSQWLEMAGMAGMAGIG